MNINITSDLTSFLKRKVITRDTYEWLKPLHEKEIADLEEIKIAAREQNFYKNGNGDDNDDDENIFTTSTTTLRGIEGATDTVVSFVTDSNSSGHGNKVWHASIATCRYLKDEFLPGFISKRRKNISSERFLFKSLELGAGTAVPSFFLAQLLLSFYDETRGTEGNQPPKSIIRITDAKHYRNIMQIIRSVGIQESLCKGEGKNVVEVEVHPHNWGDHIDLGFESAKETGNDDNDNRYSSQYDLIIVSDCIYNPLYHDVLLISLSEALALPVVDGTKRGGKAVVSFSLHGNVDDSMIWKFLDQKIPSKTRMNDDNSNNNSDVVWRLKARCVSSTTQPQREAEQLIVDREGWNMEKTMNEVFGMVTEGIKPERWLAYVYEITWVRDEPRLD